MVDLVALGVDALVIDGGRPARIGPAIRAARAVGVPVVSIAPDHPTGIVDCVARIDAPRIGRKLAEEVLRFLGEGGGLVISVMDPDLPAGLARVHPSMLEALGVPPGRDAAR
jgi:ABC-type sugar transport system substrate-binding protein